MPISLQLQAAMRNYTRDLFNNGRTALRRDFETNPIVPEDTGRLRGSFREPAVIDFGARKSFVGTVTARSSDGTDYPSILEEAPRIAPRTARVLRFFVDGDEVFSRGFDNVHHQWWTNWLDGGDVWTRALEQALVETEYRS